MDVETAQRVPAATPTRSIAQFEVSGALEMRDARNVRFLPETLTIQFDVNGGQWLIASVTLSGRVFRKNAKTLTKTPTSRLWTSHTLSLAPNWVSRLVTHSIPRHPSVPYQLDQMKRSR